MANGIALFNPPCPSTTGSSVPSPIVQPPAIYPTNVATDAQLKIAGNRRQTVTRSPISAGDTIILVADGSVAVPNMLFTIGAEIVNVVAVDGNNWTVTRGFDGTYAVSHGANRPIAALVDAWHHNALASEVKAIEAALGPNLSNIGGDTGIVSAKYDFAPQSPGIDLVAGLNVITLSPVPQGINGSNTHHYLYISGGTGAAEAVLISGGSAVSGAASGTLFITCANAHSGAWTIRSSGSGIQEAIWMLAPTGGVVTVPPGNITIRKGFAIVRNGVTVRGQGIGATKLDVSGMGAGYVCRMVSGHSNWLEDFIIEGPGSAMAASDFAIMIEAQNSSGVNRVDVAQVPNGVRITGSGNYRIWLEYMNISYLTGSGGVWISIEGGADHFVNHIAGSDVDGNDLASIRIRDSGGSTIAQSDCLQAGLLIDPDGAAGQSVRWLIVNGAMFDTTHAEGLKIAPTNGALVYGLVFTDCWFSSSATADGALLTAAVPNRIEFVSFTALRTVNNFHNGVSLTGNGIRHVTISGSLIMQNNTAAGNYSGIYISEAKEVILNANHIGTMTTVTPKHTAGIAFGAGAADNIVVTGNIIQDFTLAPIAGVEFITGPNLFFADNVPSSNLVVPLPSAASVNLGGVPCEQYHITGTVPIATLTPAWSGRKITLVFDDAAPGGVITGGNIKKAKTVTQNSMLLLQYESTGWNVIGP